MMRKVHLHYTDRVLWEFKNEFLSLAAWLITASTVEYFVIGQLSVRALQFCLFAFNKKEHSSRGNFLFATRELISVLNNPPEIDEALNVQ